MILLLLLACAPKPLPRDTLPEPLPTRTFTMPAAAEAKLGNGVRVVLLENHEVPLVYIRVAMTPGSFTDPVGKEGLADVTLDMMNEGAGPYDAAGLSTALKKLGSALGAGAGDDGASVWISTLSRNLTPTLDLMAQVLLHPTFPEKDWALMQKNRVADLARQRSNPESIASRVYDRVLFGETYRGRDATETSLGGLTPADMKTWWSTHVTPKNAIVLVGGDTTMAEVLPLLEHRFGKWEGELAPTPSPRVELPKLTPAIHLVDRPGAAQSVLRYGAYVAKPTDADWSSLLIANQVLGGQFTSRINMNLREQKGYTYGARSSLGYDHAGGRWTASAGVHADKTVPAIQELLREVREASTDRPLTEAETADARDAIVFAWPLRFESPDYLLSQTENVWRYGLPGDWITGYVDRVRAVTDASATAAWKARIDPGALTLVVVGDGASLREPLAGLGLPVILRDADGNLLPTGSP